MGGPAARAWGMEGLVTRSRFGSSVHSAALASSRTTYRSNQVHTFLLRKQPPTPDYTCDSVLHYTFRR